MLEFFGLYFRTGHIHQLQHCIVLREYQFWNPILLISIKQFISTPKIFLPRKKLTIDIKINFRPNYQFSTQYPLPNQNRLST